MFTMIHVAAVVKIDMMVRKDEPYRHEEFRRRRQSRIDGMTMWIVSPEDLVLSKLVWARDSRSELQFRDVRQIVAAVPELDRAYLDRWAHALGVEQLFREVTGV